MASSKRERELARMRAERQAARRAAEAARRRQRNAIIASVVAVALLAGIVGTIVLATRDDKPDTVASEPTPPAAASASAAPGTCVYTPSGKASKPAPTPPAKPAKTTGKVTLAVTSSAGPLELSLDAAKAPCTTSSFVTLAAAKYFDGTGCHRLTTEGIFVLQCGDPTASGTGGPGYQFADENLVGATYKRGTLAMANGGPGTNGSQFFLVYKDSPLPPSYSVVGTITKGLDVLDKVAKAGVSKDSEKPNDGTPATEVKLTKVTVKA